MSYSEHEVKLIIEAKDTEISMLKAELGSIEAGYNGLQYEMGKQLAEKDAEITKLKHDLSFISGQAASLSNDLADYASKMNSLAHYIIDEPTSSSQEAQIYANSILDLIVHKLESG